MKCIKTIKESTTYTLGEIRRVTDIEADERVKGGYWKFVPKSEWKVSKGKGKKEELINVVTEEVETTIKETKTKKEKSK
jgi:hypothetical protein